MSLAAHLFERLHRARFYRELHAEAVALVGPGEGRGGDDTPGRWLDVGAGPGLVARLAAVNGWRATALDPDPAMIERAEAMNAEAHPRGEPTVAAVVGGLDDLAGRLPADVVSAASLLVVLPDRPAVLDRLLAAVAPGGICLVVETTEAMTIPRALARLARVGWGEGGWLLLLWAFARRGARHLADDDLIRPGWSVVRHDLLDGMVAARVLRRVE